MKGSASRPVEARGGQQKGIKESKRSPAAHTAGSKNKGTQVKS